jgi:hypothetical protein
MYSELAAFYKEHGHSMVPDTFREGGTLVSLGRWVRKQRTDYVQGTLRPDRMENLEKLDFVWSVETGAAMRSLNQRKWDEVFDRLVEFKKATGLCRVPQQYDGDPELGCWVGHQRTSKGDGSLLATRAERLEAIGFEWKVKFTWHTMLHQLEAYMKRFGSCPSNRSINHVLYSWVNKQRNLQEADLLDTSKKRKLDSIGFQWSPSSRKRKRSANIAADAVPQYSSDFCAGKTTDAGQEIPRMDAPIPRKRKRSEHYAVAEKSNNY